MGVSINVSDDLATLLTARVPDVIEGKVVSNLVYMGALDDGHSDQSPDGMIDPNKPYIETYLTHAVKEATDAIARGADPTTALREAVTDATMFALRQLVLDTPVDTGRAKGSWTTILPDGKTTEPQQGPFKKSFWQTPEGRKEALKRQRGSGAAAGEPVTKRDARQAAKREAREAAKQASTP